ncbi:MAG: transcriptional regulator [Nitrospinota bacterium]|nr:transcriptional regulator [Nitrospinota bacterium]
MDRFDRIYKLDKILRNARYPVPRDTILDELGCSRATFTRILDDLRGHMGAPVVYDRKYKGYVYSDNGGGSFELPGLWFNASELYALLTCNHLIGTLQPGLLDDNLSPLKDRIDKIFRTQGLSTSEVEKRIRILRIGFHDPAAAVFQKVAEGTLKRRRLLIIYHGRSQDQDQERVVSPQRLSYYRDNWYMDAFCHLRGALRLFALDRIVEITVTDKKAKSIMDQELDDHYGTAYGIYAGAPRFLAKLRFSPCVAQWVARERWHPEQVGRAADDGQYQLEFPYSDSRELVMDILRYGPDVEVLSPDILRSEVVEKMKNALRRYE